MPIPTDIQAVVFDLDGTLLDRRRSFEAFVRDQWRRFISRVGNVDEEQYIQTLIQLDRDGYAPRQTLFSDLAAKFDLPRDLAVTLLTDYRAGFPSACVLFSDVIDTLATLRASGLKLGLITNGSARMQSRKLDALALAKMFDAIAISETEGCSKPDPRIFHRVLDRLGTAPAHSVFVGDHPAVDVAGSRGAGMFAIWRRDPIVTSVVDADAIVDKVGDLVAILCG